MEEREVEVAGGGGDGFVAAGGFGGGLEGGKGGGRGEVLGEQDEQVAGVVAGEARERGWRR